MSETKTKYLDISSRLGKTRCRVNRVGVELEGAWERKSPSAKSVIRDGSVGGFANNIIYDPVGVQKCTIGEIPSPALLPSGKDGELTLETWLRTHYPPHHNETCGMHVHMSFSNAFQYQRLMVEEYMWTVVEFLERWGRVHLPSDHHLFDRLAGNSEYCQTKFHADGQAQRAHKDHEHFGKDHRYTVINYAFSRTGTIECRVLPMMPTVNLALSAIRELLAITSAFLVVTAKKELPVVEGWIAESDSASHESIRVIV